MTEERITQRTITVVMAVIAALAFVFSFGNVWDLALRLGVPKPIAPLIAPMVDLSVLGLLVALRHLSLRGVPAEEVRTATRLMHCSGLLTLGLNVAEPIAAGHHDRAALDSVAPLLLLGWGAVGPQLLRAFHTARPVNPADAEATRPVAAPALAAEEQPRPESTPSEPASIPPASAPPPQVPEPLLHEARAIAAAHHREHGEPITVAQLKRRLGVGLPMAAALHAALAA
ncbi:DUF2637 domain-containing protein [Streptomyces sp. NPDC056600]|uniref:DUF2637 domain-containing protein n=1 Tax=Streptomyces sp. NPDC056600 TaxID=3345874 RepID=UPI0036A0B50D